MQKGKQSVAAKATYWLKVVSLGLVLGLGLQFAQAWVAPTVAPPGGNVAGPLTVGNGAQYKTGKLGVNSSIAPISAFEVGGGGDVLVGGKAYSASTVASDLGTTLATKDYVDSKVGGGGGITGSCGINASGSSTQGCWGDWNCASNQKRFSTQVMMGHKRIFAWIPLVAEVETVITSVTTPRRRILI
jgi:hypothetical protein